MLELRIHGYGGQGTVTLAHLLAQAALNNGKQAQALPSFGVERRGAPVKAVVRMSDDRILVHSQSRTPDILVLMNKKLVQRGLSEGAGENSILIVNAAGTDGIEAEGHCRLPRKSTVYTVDAAAIAAAEGLMSADGPFINIPMLGAAAKVAGISENVLEQTLRNQWKGEAGDKNVRAALTAYRSVVC